MRSSEHDNESVGAIKSRDFMTRAIQEGLYSDWLQVKELRT